MALSSIDASLLKKLFLSGARRIEAKKEYINELNVFPVPDGDTGTNMTLTILSAAKEVQKLEEPTMAQLAKAISSGSLRGARGNSGVILSQLLRGFCKVIAEYDELTIEVLRQAAGKAVETAYKAVMKPKEGTILTVARAGAEKADEIADEVETLEQFGALIIEAMHIALEHTPELLPVLKEAGVVDSGGQGLVEILLGVRDAYLNPDEEIVFEAVGSSSSSSQAPRGAANDSISTADIKFGYCTEFIILLEKEFLMPQELEFKSFLESIGDSIVCVADDDVVKVHVHTNDPGLAIQKALTFGQLTSMKIDNMREEHNERVIQGASEAAQTKAPATPKKTNGFIAVSIGQGMNDIFKGLGVDYIIEGGQTMNPSTEDMLTAIDAVNADNVFILPNNSNIILAASQAKALTEDKNVIVIPSKTIPQGISAMINFLDGESPEDNEAAMTEGMTYVKTGQVTYAVRDTSVDGFEIHVNDIMGIGDKNIVAVGSDITETALETIRVLASDGEAELVSIYYGEGITEEAAGELADMVGEEFADMDIEVHEGGQPVYYYVISVE
ncbi:MAG: DAK2 domain-containing protein [Lachnospiraceae bacterium]